MHICIIQTSISLPGCASLKEKRRRVGGLHARFGRNPWVALCESGALDCLYTSEWSFVVVAHSRRDLEARCAEIENKLEQCVDGRIVSSERSLL